MDMKRRSFLGITFGSIAALVLPELASARTGTAAATDTADVPWQWQARQARAVTDAEREKYLPLFESDFENMERSYGARIPGEPVSMSISDTVAGTVVALGAALVTARIYARHVELAADGTFVRAATTTFAVSDDMKNLQLYSMGPNARSAVASRAQFDATAPAAAKACTPPKKSCRTCSDLNTGGVLACCGACAWAGGNPYALLSCAIIMCAICASQNCRRWTYACCDY